MVAPGVLGYASNITVPDLLKYTNQKREEAGLLDLAVSKQLTAAAQKKAAHMFAHNYWAHIAPDGTDPWSFVVAENYDYLYAGENLAKNFSSSKDVVEAWYKSPSHRENLLSNKYLDVGFASVNGILDGYETTLVVQMFGRTRNAPALPAQVGVVEAAGNKSQAAQPVVLSQPSIPTSPTINVYTSSKIITLLLPSFVLLLLALDVWYSRKHAILKFTGHSLAHMLFLIFAVTILYLSLGPGRVL